VRNIQFVDHRDYYPSNLPEEFRLLLNVWAIISTIWLNDSSYNKKEKFLSDFFKNSCFTIIKPPNITCNSVNSDIINILNNFSQVFKDVITPIERSEISESGNMILTITLQKLETALILDTFKRFNPWVFMTPEDFYKFNTSRLLVLRLLNEIDDNEKKRNIEISFPLTSFPPTSPN